MVCRTHVVCCAQWALERTVRVLALSKIPSSVQLAAPIHAGVFAAVLYFANILLRQNTPENARTHADA